ncbi:Uncharacterised protein [uncultured archaeon]|nr:Uncharacterised protein [uncultured archaeon]
MPEAVYFDEGQKKAIEAILSGDPSFGIKLDSKKSKFDAFNAILGTERMLTDLKSKIPLSFRGESIVECDPSNSSEVVSALVKLVLEMEMTPVIILMNFTYKSVLRSLKSSGLDEKVIIVDTVSKVISHVEDGERIFFVDSPRNLTQLQIKMINIMDSNKNTCFIFDSLGILALYHEENVVLKFVYSLTKLLHKYASSGFFVSAGKTNPRLIQFFDEEVKAKKFI